jgi:hypothetical protein
VDILPAFFVGIFTGTFAVMFVIILAAKISRVNDPLELEKGEQVEQVETVENCFVNILGNFLDIYRSPIFSLILGPML